MMNPESAAPIFDMSLWMNKSSFVAWRKPGEKKQHGFKALVGTLPDGNFIDKDAFIFSPFYQKRKLPVLAFYPLIDQSDSAELLNKVSFPFLFPNDRADNKSAYCKRLQLLIEILKEGSLNKCVLSRRIDLLDPDENMAPEIFSELCNRYPQAFVSLIHIPGVFTWLGATPERFLKVKDQKGHTTALAATKPFNGILPELSEWNKKEREEQQLVTDFILNVLSKTNVENIDCQGPKSSQAGNLVHLKSDIHFTIPAKTDLLSLINALHPTPAVCGLPKEEALRMINKIEPHDREYYAGYMGLVDKNEMELYVNLRCMRWLNGKPSLFVGGGITAASVPEQEWEETNFKAHTLLDVIEKICNLAGKNPDAH